MDDHLKTWKQIAAATDEVVVGICNYRDRILVATSRGVYELIDGALEEIKFRVIE
jgi:hypothetical protein